jgi:hypothetical protein
LSRTNALNTEAAGSSRNRNTGTLPPRSPAPAAPQDVDPHHSHLQWDGHGAPQRATFDAEEDDDGAAWSPDWKELAYTRRHGTIWRQPPGPPIRAGSKLGCRRLGARLVAGRPAARHHGQSALKTFLIPLTGGGSARQVLDIPERRTQHRISPDGKRIAIMIGSGERSDVWVAAFPDLTDRRRISVNGGSVNGGSLPVWRKDGRELYLLEPDGTPPTRMCRDAPLVHRCTSGRVTGRQKCSACRMNFLPRRSSSPPP